MPSKHADVVVTAAAAAAACVFATVADAPTWLSAVVGFVVVAACGYLPGTLLFGSKISGLERVTVFAGLALAVPVLGGLVLYVAGVPLRRPAWLLLLGAVALACDAALYLRRLLGKAEPFTPPKLSYSGSPLHVTAFTGAVLVAVLAVVVARAGAGHQPGQQFTQLGLTADHKHPAQGTLAVTNDTGAATSYRLVLLQAGQVTSTWNFSLADGRTWSKAVTLPGVETPTVIRANLYKMPDVTHIYRWVTTGTEAVSN